MAEVRGDRLKELMREQGLTQSELARLVGVKQPTIGRLLNGQTRSTSVLVEIAYVLGTTPEFLTSDDADSRQSDKSLSAEEVLLLEKLRTLSPEDRKMVLALTKKLAGR